MDEKGQENCVIHW